MKKQTKKKQMQNNKQKRNKNKNRNGNGNKIMPMLPKQKKTTPSGMILGLIYLDMLHHIQPHRDKEIMDKQREILKPFIKKEKNKTSKVKRGGHVFYYNVLPEVCGVDVHENDCVPSTLYFLGLLTYEAAQYLAHERWEGLDYRSILVWLDENFPDEDTHHVSHTILDLRDYFLETNEDGYDIYDEEAIEDANEAFMENLNTIMPYTQMGVIAGSVYYSEDNNQESTGGHVFCIIKDENEEFYIIDPQQRRYGAIHSIHDAVEFLKSGTRMYELTLYLQEDVVDELNTNEPDVRGPNNYIVPNPHAFNAEHMLEINRQHNEENAEWNDETGRYEDEGGYYIGREYYPFN
jgi:hypothetical protein